MSVKNTSTTNRVIEKEIYKAFAKHKSQDISVPDILREVSIDSAFNPRFEFSTASVLKSLILMKLKGIRSQSKLAQYLKTHEEVAIKLGFFRDRNNRIKTPDQRTFSYFIKSHLNDERRQIIDFASSKIEDIADKFGVVLDIEILNKNSKPKENKSEKTFYNNRSEKLNELCRLVRKRIYPRIRLDIRNNSVFRKSDFLDLLVHIALTEDFAENGSRTFQYAINKRTPTSDTLLYHIKKFEDREVLQKMFIEVFDLVYKMSKRSNLFGGRKVDVAIERGSSSTLIRVLRELRIENKVTWKEF